MDLSLRRVACFGFLVAYIGVWAACSDDREAPAPVPCPVDERACEAAATIQGWLDEGEPAAILARYPASDHTCPGPEPEFHGEPFPLCNGATAGEIRTGYVLGIDTTALVYSLERMTELLDQRGTNRDWRAVSVACPREADPAHCQQSTVVSFAAFSPAGELMDEQGLILFELKFDGSGWHLQMITSAFLFGLRETLIHGGEIPVDAHAAVAPYAEAFPWSTP